MEPTNHKTLKFTPTLVELIVRGKKTATWRLFDDKALQVGDSLIFINAATGDRFGTAIICTCVEKTLGSLTENDWDGHERYQSDAEMYETYSSYYGRTVGPDTKLKIITFDFTPLA